MIELVVAALIQIATITSDATLSPSTQGDAATVSVTSTVDGGTGTWDDNN